jgi:hypothetical protein
MSLNAGGRVSGVFHIWHQLPKSVQACLVAAGLSVVTIAAVPADQKDHFIRLATIEAYCKNPAKSVFPDFIAHKLNKVCLCASGGPVCI